MTSCVSSRLSLFKLTHPLLLQKYMQKRNLFKSYRIVDSKNVRKIQSKNRNKQKWVYYQFNPRFERKKKVVSLSLITIQSILSIVQLLSERFLDRLHYSQQVDSMLNFQLSMLMYKSIAHWIMELHLSIQK